MSSASKTLKSQAQKIRLRDDLYAEIDRIADEGRREGMSRTGLVEQAVEEWLARRASSEKSGRGNPGGEGRFTVDQATERWHYLLKSILQSGYTQLADAIKANLEAFAVAAKLAQDNGVDSHSDSFRPHLTEIVERLRRVTKRDHPSDEGNEAARGRIA